MADYDVRPLEGYPDDLGLLLATLQEATRDWRFDMQFEGEITVDNMTWQIRPGGHSLGAIFLHIAEAEISWFEVFALGKKMSAADKQRFLVHETNIDEGIWPTPPREPYEWYLAQMDEARRRTLAACKEFPSLDQEFQFFDRGTLTYRWVLAHVIAHEAYHAGQAMLIRSLQNTVRQ